MQKWHREKNSVSREIKILKEEKKVKFDTSCPNIREFWILWIFKWISDYVYLWRYYRWYWEIFFNENKYSAGKQIFQNFNYLNICDICDTWENKR